MGKGVDNLDNIAFVCLVEAGFRAAFEFHPTSFPNENNPTLVGQRCWPDDTTIANRPGGLG